jgi:hypothetical protein
VNNEALRAGYKAFLHPRLGYQLLYPETWPTPSEKDGQLLFQDLPGAIRMGVSAHPDMSDQPIVDLKQRALEAYGDVTVLYEDQVQVGQSGGLRTVYGYESAAGPRTGILLTFSQDNQAYVVDIDGSASEEAALLELAGVVQESWTMRDVAPTGYGRWAEANIDGLPVLVPADHRFQQMSNGWRRFAADDELTFLALRSEPVASRELFEGMEHWLGVASGNVQDFSASQVYAHERAGRSWARVDFEYALVSGERVAGAIMITRINDRFLILWAESLAGSFEGYESEVLLTLVDELSRDGANQP